MMWGWDGMAAGWIFMTVFWVLVIALVVWAVAALSSGTRGRGVEARETPEEILDRRFARGELDTETYRQMREELRGRDGVRA